MKKLALILCAVLIFSMSACTDDDIDNVGDNGTNDTGTNDTGTNGTDTDMTGANGGADKDTLTGTAQGYGGEVKVTVTVDGDDIVSVEAVGEKETKGIGSNAIDELPDKIEEADSTDVDGISGATGTSNAIKEAVDKAMGNK